MAKRCIVLGGSGHVGQAICRGLSARGARVGFTYHQGEELAAQLCAELPGATSQRLDLTREDEIAPAMDALLEALDGVDAFVHAASLVSTNEPPEHEKLAKLSAEGWDRLMAVNLKGPALACQHLAPHFGDSGGNLVFVGSTDGVKAVPTPIAYGASKAALSGLVRALAKELGARKILANVVAPGVLEGGLSRTLPDELRQEFIKHSALGRLGTREEVAKLVTFLALDNSYLTARTIVVDGGL